MQNLLENTPQFIPSLPMKPQSFSPSHSHQHYSLKSPKHFKKEEREMDLKVVGLENPFLSAIHQMLLDQHIPQDEEGPTRTYVRDAKAMASTPVDIKEYPTKYVFEMDMPGIRSEDIHVQVEDDNVLVISGERKREEDKEAKYVRMERRVGKFMRKFNLPENANIDAISAVCQDGVLTVTVEKKPPPEPKKPKTIEVKVA